MTHRSLYAFAIVIFFTSANVCSAATLTLGSGGSHVAGSTFTVPVYVSAENGEAINAISATVAYPRDLVRVVSIADSGLVNLWAEKPSFSNVEGTAGFQGIIYNPGFSGTSGKIVAITFKALAAGTGQLEFKSPSVLANDGSGTEILTGARTSTITITEAARAPAAPAAPKEPAQAPKPAAAPSVPNEATPAPPAPEAPAAPTATPVPPPPSFIWTVVAAFTLPGFIFLAAVIGWLMWPRILHLMHIINRILSSQDQKLQDEMYVIHYTLTEELKRLRRERQTRELSMSERRIFMRFTTLQDRIEKLIGKNIQKED